MRETKAMGSCGEKICRRIPSSKYSVTLFPVHETYSYFEEFWKNVKDLTDSLRLLRLAVEHSRIRKDAALARARDGFTAATHMAEQLTVENMTGELMREESVGAVGFAVERTDEQIAAMLDPLASLNAKVTGGTPRPADTRRLLAAGRNKRTENEVWLASARKKASDAYAQVERGIE